MDHMSPELDQPGWSKERGIRITTHRKIKTPLRALSPTVRPPQPPRGCCWVL
jgi:hypothetical protein